MDETENLVAKYQGALRKLRSAKERAERIVTVITETSEKLKNWKQMPIPGSRGFTSPMIGPGSQALDINSWPNGQQLEEAITAYHQAKDAADIAWRAIPENDKIGLQAPTDHH